jgi:Cu-processing system permease protein
VTPSIAAGSSSTAPPSRFSRWAFRTWDSATSAARFENFSSTTASILNLCLLLAPLIALSMGAGSIAGERDRGNLTYLLSQPLNRWELLLGKYAGLVTAISVATIAGFGAAGLVIATFAHSMDVGTYVLLLGLAVLVAIMTGMRRRLCGLGEPRASAGDRDAGLVLRRCS